MNISYDGIIEKPNVNINLEQAKNSTKPFLYPQQEINLGVELYSNDYLHLFITRNFYIGLIFYGLFMLQYFFIFRKLITSKKISSLNKLILCAIETVFIFIIYLHTINIFYLFDYILYNEILTQILLTVCVIPLYIIGVNVVFYAFSLYKIL